MKIMEFIANSTIECPSIKITNRKVSIILFRILVNNWFKFLVTALSQVQHFNYN